MTRLSEPLVTVIVAVHDVADYVGAAIGSLKAQTLAEFEALVIDDGSGDASGDAARAAIGADARFHLIRQENAGLSAVRNRGLEAARGSFVAFLDGDDTFEPTFLQDLHAAMERDGTDWAACAVSLVYPDGQVVTHPAIHGAPDPGPARAIALRDARDIARLFPSAWNKLYRRTFLADLRFPEGSWFEDHEMFWALASRRQALSYCPRPLVRHRRGRPGQITDADSDRVFQQFDVLERLRPQIQDSGLEHADAAFSQLATRLIHERALAVRDRARRQRYVEAARDFLHRHGLRYDPDTDPEVSRGLACVLRGEAPLSVVVLGGGALDGCLAALDLQQMADFDLTVVAPDGTAVPGALHCGQPIRRLTPDGLTWAGLAARLEGRSVVIVNHDARLLPDGLLRLVNLIEQTDAPMGFAGLERDGRGYHDGWTNNAVAADALAGLGFWGGTIDLSPAQALRLHPVLGNRILRRDVMARVNLPVAGDALSVQALVLDTALTARTVAVARHPVLRVPDVPGRLPPTEETPRQVAAMRFAGMDRLPAGWQAVLLLRIERFRLYASEAGPIRAWLAALARLRGSGLPPISRETRPDPETPRWVCVLARLVGRWGKGHVASR